MGETEDFEWHDDKDAANLGKHGLPLRLGVLLFADPYLREATVSDRGGEARLIAVGKVEERVLTCVFTFRGHRRRLISLRAARRSERRDYLAQMDDRRDQG